jgi:transcriptional regulator with XRE-family HTH domain
MKSKGGINMDIVKIGEYIRQRLKEKGLTQEHLAGMLGVSSPAVSQVLNGKNLFDYPNMMNLAKILDEPMDRIINAGEEAETYLDELSKLTPEIYEKKDPDYSKIRDKDSKSKTLIDYVLKNKNYDLAIKLDTKGCFGDRNKDIRLATLLIEKNDSKIYLKHFIYTMFIIQELSNDVYDGEHLKPFESFSQEEQEYIKALVNCNNEEILNSIQYLANSNQIPNKSPAIVLYAIQFNRLDFLKFIEIKQNYHEPKFRHIIESKYAGYMHFAITHKSISFIEYFYGYMRVFDSKKYFETLMQTKDISYIQEFLKKYPAKGPEFQIGNSEKTFNNFSALKPLIVADDIVLLTFAIQSSNQEALDNALHSVKPSQIELMKILLNKGARFLYSDSTAGRNEPLENLSAFVTALLHMVEGKK